MPESLHMLFLDYVSDMAQRRGPHREAHLDLIRRYHAEGRIVIAGALGDPPATGALAFRDPADIDPFVAEDSYVVAGLVVSWRVEPWAVVT